MWKGQKTLLFTCPYSLGSTHSWWIIPRETVPAEKTKIFPQKDNILIHTSKTVELLNFSYVIQKIPKTSVFSQSEIKNPMWISELSSVDDITFKAWWNKLSFLIDRQKFRTIETPLVNFLLTYSSESIREERVHFP